MAILQWEKFTSLENSLYEFLTDIIADDSIQVLDDKGVAIPVNVRIGYSFDSTWELPVISLCEDSRVSPRGFIGSNTRIKTFLMILDIRGLNDSQRSDLTTWLEETINAGFPYYKYTPSGDPQNPTKDLQGHVAVEFTTNLPLRLDDGDLAEKYRQRMSISCQIEGF